MIKASIQDCGPELGLRMRAGDENRTRTISLGTGPERPPECCRVLFLHVRSGSRSGECGRIRSCPHGP
jgi:hypothetical protein